MWNQEHLLDINPGFLPVFQLWMGFMPSAHLVFHVGHDDIRSNANPTNMQSTLHHSFVKSNLTCTQKKKNTRLLPPPPPLNNINIKHINIKLQNNCGNISYIIFKLGINLFAIYFWYWRQSVYELTTCSLSKWHKRTITRELWQSARWFAQ